MLLRAVNELPGDVDRKGDFKDARLRGFVEACEDVVDFVEGMEGVRGCWLEVLRRGQEIEYKESKMKKAETLEDGDGVGVNRGESENVDNEIVDQEKIDAEEQKIMKKKEDLWAAQQKYEDEIIMLAEEAKVIIWRLLTGEEPAQVIKEKKDGEGEDEKSGFGTVLQKVKGEDAHFFGHIDKFSEENMDNMDPKLKRYSRY